MQTMLSSVRFAGAVALTTDALLAAPSQCFALWFIKDVSPDEAKKMGVAIRVRPAGEQAGMLVTLEFDRKGDLKDFLRVELTIHAGGKNLASAPLLTSDETPDKVASWLTTLPEHLPRSVLRIFVKGRERTIYQFALKNFIEPHVTGPLTFALWSKDASLKRDSDQNMFVVRIGWPDPGARDSGDRFESLATMAVPADVHPMARFEFPHKDSSQPPIMLHAVLDQRC